MTYRPELVKQGDGTKCQWQNCVAASTAMALDRHTRGNKHITPHRIRRFFGRYCPGIPYSVAVNAVRSLKNAVLIEKYGITRDEFKRVIKSGRGAVFHIKYARILGTPFAGSSTFTGLHAIYVNEFRWNSKKHRGEYLVFDPLADGRYPWIPKGPQWWPAKLLHGAAEDAGGYFAVFTRDTE